MATSQDIKGFIAQWLQLGKGVEKIDGTVFYKPAKVLDCHGYSREFEDWWQEFELNPQKWALSGSTQPLSALYSPKWEIVGCARCDMPIPMQVAGVNDRDCPCHDLMCWPNLELPHPHIPADAENRLSQIHKRLNAKV